MDGITDSVDMNLSKLCEIVEDRAWHSMGLQRVRHKLQLNNNNSAACGILAPLSGIEPMPLALEAQNLNHWTTRKVPRTY